jgi:hypothetical protein
MRALRLAALLAALSSVLITLPAAASSTAAVVRVAVAGPGVTPAFPRGISIELHAPPSYTKSATAGSSGTWLGPEYWASDNVSLRGRTSIQWAVGFVHGSKSVRQVASAGLKMGWPLLRRDPIAVPHIAAGNVIGTIFGWAVLTRGKGSHDASYEGSMAFPVARRAYARLRFVLDRPPSDAAGSAGEWLVNGQVSPSAWEPGQVFWAYSGARLLGRLPPKKVLIGVQHREVHGFVHDYFTDPVPGARVTLERHSRTGWSRVATSRANPRGRFSITAAPKAVYRVRASAAGSSANSRAVAVAK